MALLRAKRLIKTVIVPADQAAVWEKWTTEAGITSFFAPACHIEMRIGGPYEMYFLRNAKKGEQGSEGCKILTFLPQELLSFSWNAPPQFPKVRNSEKTWVILQLTSMPNERTFVKLTHYGWQEGDDWEPVYHYFDRAWSRVLDNLLESFKEDEQEQEEIGLGTKVNRLASVNYSELLEYKEIDEEEMEPSEYIELAQEETEEETEFIEEVELAYEENEEEIEEEELEEEEDIEEEIEIEAEYEVEEEIENEEEIVAEHEEEENETPLEIPEILSIQELSEMLDISINEVVEAGLQAGLILSNKDELDGVKVSSIMHVLGREAYTIVAIESEKGRMEEAPINENGREIEEHEMEEEYEEEVEEESYKDEIEGEYEEEYEEGYEEGEYEEEHEEEYEEEFEEEYEDPTAWEPVQDEPNKDQLKIQMASTQVFLVGQDEFGNILSQHDSVTMVQYKNQKLLGEQLKEIEEKNEEQIVVIRNNDYKQLKTAFWKQNKLHIAAGGLVVNELGELLLMYRRGKWDLPKGHAEDGESIEETALREVEEETGVEGLKILAPIYPTEQLATYHTYRLKKGKRVLKETFWFLMECEGSPEFIPQTEEDIERVEWVDPADLKNYLDNTYQSIIEVINAGLITSSLLP